MRRMRKPGTIIPLGVFLIMLCSLVTDWIRVHAQNGGAAILSPTSLSFTAQTGGAAPPSKNVSVTSSISTKLNFRVRTSATWLSVTPTSGTTPATLRVSVNPSGLTPGSYSSSISVITGEETSRSVAVTFTVTQQTRTLQTSPSQLNFSAQQNGNQPPSQTFTVRTSNGSAVAYTIGVQGSPTWLTVTPSSGTTPRTETVSVNPEGLAPGTYLATIRASSSIGSASVGVQFIVTAAQALTVTPTTLAFRFQRGGAVPGGQTLTVGSTTPGLSYTASASTASGGSWLVVAPASGTTPAAEMVTVRPSGLAVGTYNGTITLAASTNTLAVPVTLTVTSATNALSVSPTSLAFGFQQGGTTPASQNLSVASTTAGVSFTAAASTTTGGPWLMVTPTSATTPATVQVSVTASALAVGTYQGTVQVTSSIGTLTVPVTLTVTPANTAGGYVLLAWSELGMHCIDGKDYSILSLLPPYNTVFAKLMTTGTTPTEVTSGVTLSYTAFRDASGSINTTSSTKTNFWSYVKVLFGLSPAPDVGLLGTPVQSLTPHPMTYGPMAAPITGTSTTNVWRAEGIPTAPYDDNGNPAPYSMVQITARSSGGTILAQATTVLGVSDELSCANCHAANTNPNAMPSIGWVNFPQFSANQNWRLNVLAIHDDLSPIPPAVLAAANAKGYNYQTSLYQTAYNNGALGSPVLCDVCHQSNVFSEVGFPTGVPGVNPLTQDIHTRHARVTLPGSATTLDNMTGNTGMTSGCYQCHPGPTTQCQRGVMTGTIPGSTAISCYGCHGNVSRVGVAGRSGWMDLPTCQTCHQGGQTFTSAFITSDIGPTGTWRTATDTTFATNPNTPQTGTSLFRFSTGHGGVNCSGCHNSQHAEFLTNQPNDGVLAIALQGYNARITECSACHTSSFATSPTGGPHGMHTVGSAWVSAHPNYVESHGTASCAYCHGSNFRGTSLSRLMTQKTLAGHTFPAYHEMNCYDCHNGPGGG